MFIRAVINNIQTLNLFRLTFYTFLILSVVGLFIIPPGWLIVAILVTMFLQFPLQLISHECITHEYIVPRNNFIKFILLLLWAIVRGEKIEQKKNFHYAHHLHSGDIDRDPTAHKLLNTKWWEYMFDINIQDKHMTLPTYTTCTFMSGKIIQLHEKYTSIIFYSWMIFFAVFTPLWVFIAVVVYPKVYLLLLGRFHDYYFHGAGSPRPDSAWLLPFYGPQSWHNRHHNNWETEFYGHTKLERYLNLSWYLRCLFVSYSPPKKKIVKDLL